LTPHADALLADVTASLQDRLALIKRDFEAPMVLGPAYFQERFSGRRLKGKPDLLLSVFRLHHADNIPRLLQEAYDLLEEGGVFLCAFFGGASLSELRRAFIETDLELRGGASPHIVPMVRLEDFAALLERSPFTLPVVDVDRHQVSLSVSELWATLRALGEKNTLPTRSQGCLSRFYFQKLEEKYQSLPTTVEIFYGIGWKVDPQTLKVLKPGSGQISLADIL